ncbi:MAG: energy-coupling factor transporter transmembrane protein EcfT, partial [Clostridia bacterium]|nr:energy-coupling factor transporter transmembrane protein EcfT [Clostridia bacterium]
MNSKIALGQYYPANSPIHRADGRIKIVCSVIYMVAAFLCASDLSFVWLTAATVLLVAVSRVPLRVILRSIRMIIFILVLTFVLNAFLFRGEGEPLFSFWKITLYKDGIRHALKMALRLVDLITATSLIISYTTTPVDITHSLESVLSPLKLIKIPVHYFSMMMFIALRFIPTLAEDTDRIITAQKSRGADFTEGSLLSRIKSLVPVLIPLFLSSFRRAEELADAMECRCYHGDSGRTRMNKSVIRTPDIILLFCFVLLSGGVVALNLVFP